MNQLLILLPFLFCSTIYRDASDQRLKRNEGNVVNQLKKATAVAVSNCVKWFCAQISRSWPIRTVTPAEAQAAANVRVDVTCSRNPIDFQHNSSY
ncbi:hypothetical protein V6N13_082539 [Hibiscus sabdariffa]